MSIFYHEEAEAPNPSKRSKFLATCLMDAFSNCHTSRRLQTSSPEAENHSASDDFDDEQEVLTKTRMKSILYMKFPVFGFPSLANPSIFSSANRVCDSKPCNGKAEAQAEQFEFDR